MSDPRRVLAAAALFAWVGLAGAGLARAGLAPTRAGEAREPEERDEASPGDLVPGDTAYGQEAGELELELEASWIDGQDEEEIEVLLGLEYGLTDRVQLSAAVPYLFVSPHEKDEPRTDGFDRAELGLQFALLAPDAPAALSFAVEAAFPVAGREGPGDDETAISAGLLTAWVRGATEVYGGVTGTFSDDPTELEVEVGVVRAFGRVAVDVQLTWLDDGDETSWELRPEVVVEDLGPFDLGVAVPHVFRDGEDEWGVALTLTWGVN